MATGRVKFFNEKKSWGFIESEGKDYFVYYKEIISDKSFKSLKENETVEFTPLTDAKGDKATQVKVIKE